MPEWALSVSIKRDWAQRSCNVSVDRAMTRHGAVKQVSSLGARTWGCRLCVVGEFRSIDGECIASARFIPYDPSCGRNIEHSIAAGIAWHRACNVLYKGIQGESRGRELQGGQSERVGADGAVCSAQ